MTPPFPPRRSSDLGGAQHHDCTAFRQRHDKAGRPGHPMRMDDDGMGIIERYAPLFLAIEGDNQKSAIRGQMQTITGPKDHPVHRKPLVLKSWQNMENFWITWSRNEDPAKLRRKSGV